MNDFTALWFFLEIKRQCRRRNKVSKDYEGNRILDPGIVLLLAMLIHNIFNVTTSCRNIEHVILPFNCRTCGRFGKIWEEKTGSLCST
jgi:hypothetical protein